MVVLGLDLAGVESRPTGFCMLQDDLTVETGLIYTDEEIMKLILTYKPSVTAIDAPLFLPKGRASLEDRSGPHLRKCDRILLNSGIRFFPITLGPMRKLTSRGISLKNRLDAAGLEAIEVYPGGAQDVLGISRGKYNLDGLKNGLIRLGLKGLKDSLSIHELDAATAAYVGYLYCIGEYSALGDPSEGYMIMPKSEKFKPY
ncbi:DUF429 domain-containing protein [Candidatus Bathyarchaeota archaeon]|nr:DUF429 domain-containing protein [Candidatus Bathyarchaeota archaeon]MBS7613463.1 DUF429 domain-containing protein [Candidatus Bathyarchaeota archaeon]